MTNLTFKKKYKCNLCGREYFYKQACLSHVQACLLNLHGLKKYEHIAEISKNITVINL